MAGTTENMGDLVEYLINSGVRYKQEPYGPRPAKFAVVSEKMMSGRSLISCFGSKAETSVQR